VKVLVTGASGKVGAATVEAVRRRGHEVTACDSRPGSLGGELVFADMVDPGDAFAVVRGHDAVIHAAAIPGPLQHPPHTVFRNNLMGAFNALEAAVRWSVPRFVNISSETVAGMFYAERDFTPDYLPLDEEHPLRPQDPYALAKVFSEQLCDAAVERSDIRCISIRPSWVQAPDDYARELGTRFRDAVMLADAYWAYVDLLDLADLLAMCVESDLEGHEAFYVASPDSPGGVELSAAVSSFFSGRVEVRPHDRPDASGVSSAKARRLLGYRPTRSWRDHLDEEGRPLPR
jgi:UDP-glucose 4-epimerase